MAAVFGVAEGFDLGVGEAGAVVPAGADELAALDEHGTDERIGGGAAEGAGGQTQGAPHPGGVGVGVARHGRDRGCGGTVQRLVTRV